MDLHIIGGFLGSGKTTAIIGAAKHLMARGKRVGVVTNDQGKYLVDTAFFVSAAVPAVEVTGGCFCCNYDDLDARLAQLSEEASPDVIFAESVGSCADIVATVVKPLLALRAPGSSTPASFSVFADARLLRRRLLGQPMPFSDDVVYLFDKQIEEAGLLVINKRDLLTDADAAELYAMARAQFPTQTVRLQNSLDPAAVAEWLADLEQGLATPPVESLEIDYQRYGAGEADLAWLDERLEFHLPAGQGQALVTRLMEGVLAELARRSLAIGHLKVMVRGDGVEAKISFPTLEVEGWQEEIPPFPGTTVTMLINARVEAGADELRTLVGEVVTATAHRMGATVEVEDVAAFHPSFPNPTHRLA